MKKLNKILALLLAAAMLFALAACGDTAGNEETQNPDPIVSDEPDPVVSDEPEAPSIAGTYRFKMLDAYGDATSFTVTLKDGGEYNIMTAGAMGSALYVGTWTDNGDGTFTASAPDNALDVDWVEADGSSVWAIDGSDATPVNYTEPTEFLDKAAFADPTNAAEAVGIYTFGQINAWGSTVPYVIWVNADGTYAIHMNNSFTGLHTYTGSQWSVNGEGVVTFGPATFEGDPPMGDWFNADAGYTSSWKLKGDGTCEPAGYTGSQAPVDLAAQPAEIYPAGASYVGVYAFGQVNAWGSTVPYIVWINADGTAVIHMNNSFTGLHTYTATEWTDNGDGTVAIGAVTFEGDPPMGDWFAADTYTSAWTLNSDGTCVPAGYTGSQAPVDLSAQPAEIWPAYNGVTGVYYFGQINAWGSTVPYAVVLKADGTAVIVMDNSFTGVHAYSATEYTDNGDGTVSIGAVTFEGDPPMGDWFDEAAGYTSTWKLSGSSCEPAGYTGSQAPVTAESFSADATAVING